MKMTKSIVGAIKRKDVKALAGEILRSEGLDTEADEIEQAGRLTTALIDRTCVAVDAVDAEESPEPTVNEDEVEHQEPETVSHDFKAIKKAIKKGKGKKAMKLIVEAKEAGARGSVLKDLQKQAEAL